ncbi:MAG: sulfatase-like hydrolase/transferase, partial [Planctomycetota bacterium]
MPSPRLIPALAKLLAVALTLLAALSPPRLLPAQERPPGAARPHIVVIVSDDAGYADFSVNGAQDIRTPRIDSIAAAGVRCSDGYVSGCVCSPSRAGLLTGRYQQRFGHEFNIPPRYSETNGLPLSERTIADELARAGYRTVALGKWHLGYADEFHPLSRGFANYFGFLQGARSYFPLKKATRLNRLLRDREVQVESFDYMTDELGRQAARYIEGRGDEPLFLYIAYNAVHTPMHAMKGDLEGLDGKARRRKLVAMTHALDRSVGYVLDALAREDILDDTLVCFVNDNGGATNNSSRNGVLRGRKGQLFEGGIRVPFFMQWPNGLPKGRVCRDPIIALDLLPTFLAAAGIVRDGGADLDGVDLLPFLRGEAVADAVPHDRLYWRSGSKRAVRQGRWKLVWPAAGDAMLFDLGADVGESRDLAAEDPKRVAALTAHYE